MLTSFFACPARHASAFSFAWLPCGVSVPSFYWMPYFASASSFAMRSILCYVLYSCLLHCSEGGSSASLRKDYALQVVGHRTQSWTLVQKTRTCRCICCNEFACFRHLDCICPGTSPGTLLAFRILFLRRSSSKHTYHSCTDLCRCNRSGSGVDHISDLSSCPSRQYHCNLDLCIQHCMCTCHPYTGHFLHNHLDTS